MFIKFAPDVSNNVENRKWQPETNGLKLFLFFIDGPMNRLVCFGHVCENGSSLLKWSTLQCFNLSMFFQTLDTSVACISIATLQLLVTIVTDITIWSITYNHN
jgi:hypothetical protein